ncbi:hypothetical protein CRG98_037982 [Punica granatum]|uniref:Uncharacterized protein n=1 Tax=Punica granatum TaxID=22663 RepID=A0A2I0IE24_PUNGR|nr:hypothetical protein CRG98_037982 [Punica granatum]
MAGLLTRSSLLSCTASSPSHLARASCNLAGSANPCELTFLQPCRVCYPVRAYFAATMAGLLTRSSLLSCTASSPSHLARASCNLAGSANPCELTFLQPCRVCYPVRAYFAATMAGLLTRSSLLSCTASSPSHLARASCNLAGSANPCELTFLQPCRVCYPVRAYFAATMAGLLTRSSLLSCTASSPSHLARASCNLAGSANPCELTFLQPCRVCYPVRAYFAATMAGLLTRSSLLSCTASSPSHLARASCNLAGSANPCELTFLQPCRVCYPVRAYFAATMAGLLTRSSLLSCTASSPSHLARASCNLAGSANPCELTFLQPCRVCYPVRAYFAATMAGLLTRSSLLSCTASSPSHLARASCNLAGSANPCELTFLQPCRVCYPVRAYFAATMAGLLTRSSLLSCTASSPSHLARASCNLAGSANPCELTFLQPCRVCYPVRAYFAATMAGLLTRSSLLSCTASSPSHLARASCNLAGSANPCELTFLQPCRVCYPVRAYFAATMAGLLTRSSLLSCTASSPSHLARASCNLAGSANPCELTFLQPCRVCYPVRAYFAATMAGLLTRSSLLSCTASSPSHLARASCNLAGSANPCELTFLQPCRVCYPVRAYFAATMAGLLTRSSLLSCTASSPSHLARASCNLAGSANPCELTFLQPCRVCYPVRAYFAATMAGLLTRSSLLSCTASSPSHLARASCNLAGSANPCELTFLQPCRVCYPVRAYFAATMAGLLTRSSLLSCTASSPSHLARASCNLAGSANPCELTFLQPCRVCYPVRAYFAATMAGLLTRSSLLSCTASSPSHLARASCNLAGSANPCELTFLQPCRVCYPVRAYFAATMAGLLTRSSLLSCTASSPSHLARASCNLAGSANPCELTFLQPCRVCYPVRAYFAATMAGLLTRSSLLSCTASSPSHLARASFRQATSLVPLATLPGLLTRARLLFCNLAGSANPCELTFHATLSGLLTRASLLSCTASSPSHLARASCNLAGSANRSPSHLARVSCNLAGSANRCELTFFATLPGLLTRASFLFLQPCRICEPVRVYFSTTLPGRLTRASLLFTAPQVRRATSLVPLATLPDLRTRASLLFDNLTGSANPCELTFYCTASSPSHLARASCNLARSSNPCELTFLQPCRVCLSMRAYFPSPQVRRATSLVPLATLLGRLTHASLLFCNLAGSAYPCELTFLHRRFAEPPRSCLLQPCRVC